MAESEQLAPSFPSAAQVNLVDLLRTSGRVGRMLRLLLAAIGVAVALNLGLALWYAAATGNTATLLSHQLLTPFLALANAALGLVVIRSRPDNPIGWIFLGIGLSTALSTVAAGIDRYGAVLPIAPALSEFARWLTNWVWLPSQLLPATFVLLLFPDGRLPSPRWRPVTWAAGAGLLILMVGLAAYPGALPEWGTRPNPYGRAGSEPLLNWMLNVGSVLVLGGVLGSIAAVAVRFRRSQGVERAQLKWLVYAVAIMVVIGVLVVPVWLSGGLGQALALELSIVLSSLATLGISTAVAFAVARYRLYDIDIIINRTLVYGVMTGVVFLIYALIVGAAGVLFDSQGNWLLALLATGVVAVLFQPLLSRLQRAVNRLLYGQRDEPLAVLAQLGQRLEDTITPDAIYPTIVETAAHALRLPYVALQVRRGEGFETAETFGRSVADPTILPLTNQGEVVGRLVVGRRAGDEEFSTADQQILRNIARQAGAAVHEAQLTADLQRSRLQLVTGREEERRRLRRDLHDGLGPSLASLHLEAGVLRRLVRSDPAAAERLVDEMQNDIRATIEDIRRVVHELRPPALDDLGLVPAIQVLAAKMGRQEGPARQGANGLQVAVDAPDTMPALPAAVEVAAYRIIQEALANVVHHANAGCAVVRLRLDRDLHVEVSDDGAGFQEGRVGGLGLRSMRERAAELGGQFNVTGAAAGGTVVRAVLPLGER
jgi:signal transduction histidine kinase